MFKHHFLQSLAKLWLETLTVFLIIILLFFIISFSSPIESIPIIGLFAGATFKLLPSLSRIINSLNQLKFVDPIETVFLNDLKVAKTFNPKTNRNKEFSFKKEIIFDNVSFSYSKEIKIIKNLNLKIQRDLRSIFGSSGKGKVLFLTFSLVSKFLMREKFI